jgi:RNA polymerase sigma-70 factor, ECF subfamily
MGKGRSSGLTSISNEDTAFWVLAAQRGSPDAFRHLHRKFVAVVHGVLLSRFRPTIAEELTQECFLIAFRKLSQVREPAKFGPWIVAIARRIDAADERRHHSANEHEEIADQGASPDAAIDAGTVLRAIGTLPDAYRETLVLRLVEGMRGAEIAAATGLTPESVRVNLHRGMRLLRDALGIEIDIRSRRQ